MAFVAISGIIPQYEDFPNWWLKAYEQGTTTPKLMADDSLGTTTFAKLELDSEGFPNTTGDAILIPFIDGAYDLWLFPTEAEADANDTQNAKQFADNVEGAEPSSTTSTKLNPLTVAAMTADTSWSAADVGVSVPTTKEFSTGNGGSGTYDVISGTGTANGFDIIAHDTEDLSFVLRKETIPDSRQYGVVGDGVTDDTSAATAFFTAIQGGTGFHDAGLNSLISTTSGSLTLSTDNTKLIGGGKFTASNSTNQLLSITADDCCVDGMQLEGDGTFTSTGSTPNADRIALIKVTGDRNAVRNCILTDGHQNFIHYDQVSGGIIEGNKLFGGITTFNPADELGYQGIRVTDSTEVTIHKNYVYEVGTGKPVESIYLGPDSLGVNSNHNIGNNVITAAWDHGIYCNTGDGNKVHHNYTLTDGSGVVVAQKFDVVTPTNEFNSNICEANTVIADTGVGANEVGIYIRDSNRSKCSLNTVVGFPNGIFCTPITYSDANLTINFNIITENTVKGWTLSGIQIGSGGFTLGECTGNNITGNKVIGTNNTSGLGISVSFSVGIGSSQTITDNEIHNCGDRAILMGNDSYSDVSNNTIINPAASGATLKEGIDCNTCIGTRIEGNHIEDSLGAPQMSYGITGNNDCLSCRVQGNVILNAQTVPIRQFQQGSHTNTFKDNQTDTDLLNSSATLGAATTTVVSNNNINTGSGYTSTVRLWPTNQAAATLVGSANCPFVATLVNGTSFTITSAGAAAGTETFGYEIIQ